VPAAQITPPAFEYIARSTTNRAGDAPRLSMTAPSISAVEQLDLVRRGDQDVGVRDDTLAKARAAAIGVLFCLVAAGLSGTASEAPEQRRFPSAPFPCDVQTTGRVVAVGDVHGAHDAFVGILRAAGLVDGRTRWSGGKAVLVQTGDVLDRGPDSRKSLDLLRRLEREAQRAGGRVYALLGNHEWMRLISDWRYVSQGELDAFMTPDSAEVRNRALTVLAAEAERKARASGEPFDAAAYRERLIEELPLGALEMRAAYGADGEYGAWLRARPAVARINGVLFLHGGISTDVAPLGCERVNAAIRDDVAVLPVPRERTAALFASGETGPLWYRGLAREPEATLEPVLEEILRAMGARAIVIGHTPVPGKITPRLAGRIIQIDTGMLNGTFYPGGAASALELKGSAATAIYLDHRESLPALPQAAAAGTTK
jgi:hypothetical protein